jgi:hypothetical protein
LFKITIYQTFIITFEKLNFEGIVFKFRRKERERDRERKIIEFRQ